MRKKRNWRVYEGLAYCPHCYIPGRQTRNIDTRSEIACCDGCGELSQIPMRIGEVVRIVRKR